MKELPLIDVYTVKLNSKFLTIEETGYQLNNTNQFKLKIVTKTNYKFQADKFFNEYYERIV